MNENINDGALIELLAACRLAEHNSLDLPAMVAKTLSVAIANAEQYLADKRTAPFYVCPVPPHCDRIVWRGRYYNLPPARPALDTGAGELVEMAGSEP